MYPDSKPCIFGQKCSVRKKRFTSINVQYTMFILIRFQFLAALVMRPFLHLHIGITKRSFNVFQVVEKKKRFYLLDSLAFSCAVLLERWAAPEGADLSPWKNSFILETMVVLAEAVPVAEVAEDDTEAEPSAKQIWPLLWKFLFSSKIIRHKDWQYAPGKTQSRFALVVFLLYIFLWLPWKTWQDSVFISL